MMVLAFFWRGLRKKINYKIAAGAALAIGSMRSLGAFHVGKWKLIFSRRIGDCSLAVCYVNNKKDYFSK